MTFRIHKILFSSPLRDLVAGLNNSELGADSVFICGISRNNMEFTY